MAKRRFDEDEDEEDPFAMIRNMFGYCLDKPALSFLFGSVVVSISHQPLYKLACFTNMFFKLSKPRLQRLFEDVAYKYLDSNFGFLCRYDPSRYAGRDEDVSDMEADFATIEMEEKRRYCFSYFIHYNIVQIEIKAYIYNILVCFIFKILYCLHR